MKNTARFTKLTLQQKTQIENTFNIINTISQSIIKSTKGYISKP